jgi:hypothetical protein
MNKPNALCKDFKCTTDDSWLGHCGDQVCESILGETPTSCPNDCGNWESPPNYFMFILFFLIALFLAVFWRQILAILKTLGRKVGI